MQLGGMCMCLFVNSVLLWSAKPRRLVFGKCFAVISNLLNNGYLQCGEP